MKLWFGCQEAQMMPRWLFIAYRCATALAILMLIAAAVSLIASAVLGVAGLWHWGTLTTSGWRSLFACIGGPRFLFSLGSR